MTELSTEEGVDVGVCDLWLAAEPSHIRKGKARSLISR